MADQKPPVYHNTIFWYCKDVALMRRFYTDLIGLDETFYRDDAEAGWLTYSSGTLQVVFIRGASPAPVLSGWGKQPTHAEGTLEVPSWVIQVPYEDFDSIVQRLKAAGDIPHMEAAAREPDHAHKAFWVRDPMGTTIELYATRDDANA